MQNLENKLTDMNTLSEWDIIEYSGICCVISNILYYTT